MKKWILYACAVPTLFAQTTLNSVSGTAVELDPSTRNEAKAMLLKAQDWLIANQQETGGWSRPMWPALTALPVWALSLGENKSDEQLNAIVKGVEFLKQYVHEDGSIFNKRGGLRNYNTALSMLALYMADQEGNVDLIKKARKYLADNQRKDAGPHFGGMGYDAQLDRNYADMSNSYIAYEAMALTRSIEDLRGRDEEKAELDWDAAVTFLEQNQNLNNTNAWMHDDGGFVYRPDFAKDSGELTNKSAPFTNEVGQIKFSSYGSMTYAGMLSFIYAGVDKEDVRVQSAYDWAIKHWSLEENPGLGQQGLYYFYNVLAKGLHTMGENVLTLSNGKEINWRNAIIQKLNSLAKYDDEGRLYWINETDRWSEGDKALVTAYTIIALHYALH